MLRTRLSLVLPVTLVALVAAMITWSHARAQGGVATPIPTLLLTAMQQRIAVSVSKHSGRAIPAYHCRHAPGGCEERLKAFAEYLASSGQRFGLDPWLMGAMAIKESGMNPFALGSLGEMGILQINPGRRDAKEVRFIRDKWYRTRCRKEPGACQQEVVEHAAQVLQRSLARCNGDLVDALGAYNTGRCGGNLRYAKRVLTERGELMRAVGLEAEQVVITKRRRWQRTASNGASG